MWVSLKTAGVVAIALGLFAACGQTDERESGETHFLLTCSGDTCGPGLECLCGVCSKPCDANEDCSSLGKAVTCVEHDGPACKTVTKSCDVECSKDADCASTSAALTCKAGKCRATSSGTQPGPLACANGCGDSECFTPGSCTLQSACALSDGSCGSVLVDENACVRPSCETDDACQDTERCVFSYWSKHYQCEQVGNQCECTNGLGLFPMHVCSPIELAGPRGNWQRLVWAQSVIGDTTTWDVTPDGALVKTLSPEQGGGTMNAQLSATDLELLTQLIDGPAVRLSLQDPEPCPIAKSRDDVVTLTLDTETLEKNVTGCLATVGALSSVSDLLEHY